MASDADLIALSALQHYLYCPRQCALIHVEQAWAENAATAEGRVVHERVHAVESEFRRGVVAFDTVLRALTETVAAATRDLIAAGRTPRMGYDKARRDGCSLLDICRPRTTGASRSASAGLEAQLDA